MSPVELKDATARDIMSVNLVCATPSMTIRELARLLEENGISGAPVVDGKRRVIGVVSRKDLIRRCSEGTPDRAPAYLFEVMLDHDERAPKLIPEPLICVQDFMTHDPLTVPPELPVREVACRMFEARRRRVIVVDENRAPIGIVTCLDLLGALLA